MNGLIALIMALSALGGGSAVLSLLVPGRLTPTQTLAFGFTLGAALIGWLVQPLCMAFGVSPWVLMAALAPGLAGLICLPKISLPNLDELSWPFWLAASAILLLVLGDLAEAFSPAADADTLAYHFALPKQFLEQGRISFTPRAVDGAVPLLYQMTYMVALGLGGERAAMLWCGATGWGLGAVVWAFARPYLSAPRALGLVALMMGVPAVLYGAGTGQVEVRLAALAIVALWAATHAQKGDWRWAVLAGMAGGFAMAIKYPGLLITGVAGLIILIPRPKLTNVLSYGLVALAAGGGWYLWNWMQSGDPVFPMLYGLLPYKSGLDWSPYMTKQLQAFIALEHPAPQSIATLLSYPFTATFAGLPNWESSRTGLGILPVFITPFALLGFWLKRRTALASPLMTIFIACLVAYGIWILAGPSQRVRHLLPFMVPATLILTIAAWHAADILPVLKRPLIVGLAAIMLLQLAGQAVFSVKNMRYVLGTQDRIGFLTNQIPFSPIAFWINAHLGPSDKVATQQREIIYLIDVPVQMIAWLDGRLLMDQSTPLVVQQLRRQGVTHLVMDHGFSENMVSAGCARIAAQFHIVPLTSRTLGIRSTIVEPIDILAMTYSTCPY